MRPPDLHFLLVQMLFALAIQEIARKFAALVRQTAEGRPIADTVSIWSHLILTTALVVTSWLGWSRVMLRRLESPQPEHELKYVYSATFLLLLVDVAIVICYYIIADGSGLPRESDQRIIHSARNETRMMVVVFSLYAVWDIMMTAWHGHFKEFGWQSLAFVGLTLLPFGLVFWQSLRTWLATFVFWRSEQPGTSPPADETWMASQAAVVSVDLALFFLICLFRALKERIWEWGSVWKCVVIVLGALFIGCLIAAWTKRRPQHSDPARPS